MSSSSDIENPETVPLLSPSTGQKSNELTIWKDKIGRFLNNQRTKAVLLILVFVDLASCLTEMFIALQTTPEEQESLDLPALRILNTISEIILSIFVCELVLRVFAFGISSYFKNFLEFLDGFVTLSALILHILMKGQVGVAFGLLIGLRVFRIVDFMQGVTETVQERFSPVVESLEYEIAVVKGRVESLKTQVKELVPDETTYELAIKQSEYERPEVSISEIKEIRGRLERFLESSTVEATILGLVTLDICIVTAELLISLFTSVEDEETKYGNIIYWMSWASVFILSVFLAEIVAKLYVFTYKRYTEDWLELFDGMSRTVVSEFS
ncbi:hypothetical protein HK098_000843 [Nowakowskiella sp. JEL0407]|nr:hypothetical protein HK098_000843 [Nowakowskiella sp. JEL0407]